MLVAKVKYRKLHPNFVDICTESTDGVNVGTNLLHPLILQGGWGSSPQGLFAITYILNFL